MISTNVSGPKKFRGRSKSRSKTMSKPNQAVVKRIVRSEIRSETERKYFRYYANLASTTTIGVADMFSPTQGTSDVNRTGDECRISSIFYRILLYAPLSVTTQLPIEIATVRIIIFQWHPTSVPVAANVLLSTATPLTSTYSHDYAQLRTILYDRVFTMGIDWQCIQYVKGVITKGFQRKVQFTAASTVGTNKIYQLNVSDSAAIPNPSYDLELYTNFTDA